MPVWRLAAILALALSAGPAVAQEAPRLPLTAAPAPAGIDPVGETDGTQVVPPSGPIVVATPVQAPAGTVVTIDQDRLFAGSAWGRRLQAEFEKAGAELAAENDRLAAQLSDEETQLTQQRATLDPTEFRELADAFDVRATEVRRERAQAVQDLNARGEAEQAAFFQAAAPLIGQVMRERGAVVVLDRRTVLLSADGIDLTNELIARLDSALGDGSDQPAITPDAPGAPAAPPEGSAGEGSAGN